MASPIPKHPSERRRRNATVPMVQLPAGGRKGPTPRWPLDASKDELHTRELHWWRQLWRKPQAAAWERFELVLTVARYCRVLAVFDLGSFSPPVMAECRQLEDRLGLNPVAMLKLRWEVAADEVAEARATRPSSRPEAIDPTAASG